LGRLDKKEEIGACLSSSGSYSKQQFAPKERRNTMSFQQTDETRRDSGALAYPLPGYQEWQAPVPADADAARLQTLQRGQRGPLAAWHQFTGTFASLGALLALGMVELAQGVFWSSPEKMVGLLIFALFVVTLIAINFIRSRLTIVLASLVVLLLTAGLALQRFLVGDQWFGLLVMVLVSITLVALNLGTRLPKREP
jgi:hypothetical protein